MSSSLSPRYASLHSTTFLDPVSGLGIVNGRPSIISSNESPSYFFRGEAPTSRPRNKSSFHLTQKIVQAAKNHKSMQL